MGFVKQVALLGAIGWSCVGHAILSIPCGKSIVQSLLFRLQPGVIDLSTSEKFYIRDKQDERFYVAADIDFTGALTMAFRTKLYRSDGSAYYSEIRAKEEFAHILSHFEGRFNRIRVIFTQPELDDDQPMDDMIRAINSMTAGGDSLHGAVWKTFFGEQARTHGFVRLYVDENGGSPGRYDFISAEFSRL